MNAIPSKAAETGLIPIIDLGAYLADEPGALEATADSITNALENIGFFVIVNHGIPKSLVDATFELARQFHAQSLEDKLSVRMNAHNNGYMAINRYMVQTSDVNANDKPDLNEAFFTKRERAADHPGVVAGRRFVGHNLWPSGLPGFREGVLRYTNALDDLSNALLPAVSLSLDLPSDYFTGYFEDSQFSFRMSHYPPVKAQANQFGIAPHSDANFMTFLAQTPIAGLQVRMPDGSWNDVPYMENAFAVNSGDMMKRWSNGRFKSTPHRVIPPVDQHRYAIPYFLGPNIDTVVECLPTCEIPGIAPQFEPITYEAYLNWWYDANYDAKKQDDATDG
jgi:isopenicillin N synthase-like dioxygenase